MPRRSASGAVATSAVAVLAGALLAGCASPASTPDPSTTTAVVPIESVATTPTDPASSDDVTAQPEPTATDDAATGAPSVDASATGEGAASDAPATSAVNRVKIGTNDYSVLDWRVVCTGLDREPSVLATADGPDGTKYVIMVLAGSDRELISLSFSAGPPNAGHSAKSGLTVTPATGQGVGTFFVDGETIASDGRGVSYGPFDQDFSVDTGYSVELACGK